MRVLLSLLFAFIAVTAAFPQLHSLEVRKDRNGTDNSGDPIKKQCRQLNKWTQITELAANQTKLDALVEKGKLDDAGVQEIKDKAANATTKLEALQANTTLVDECNTRNAAKAVKLQCKKIKGLEKTVEFANNQTAMDAFVAKKELNDTQVEKFKEKVSEAQTKLDEMKANTTLTDLCAAQTKNKGQDGTSSGAQADSSSPEQSTSGASTLTFQTLPYVFVPALAGFAAVFL